MWDHVDGKPVTNQAHWKTKTWGPAVGDES